MEDIEILYEFRSGIVLDGTFSKKNKIIGLGLKVRSCPKFGGLLRFFHVRLDYDHFEGREPTRGEINVYPFTENAYRNRNAIIK